MNKQKQKPLRKLLSLSAVVGTSIALHAGSEALAENAKNHPNILIILVDDLGWMDVNHFAEKATGTPPEDQYYETPHINRLGLEGVSFSRAYSAPLCTPSRAALLTGRNGATFGFNNAFGMRNVRTYARTGQTPPPGYLPHDLIARSNPRFPIVPASASSALPNGSPESGGLKVYSLAEMLPEYRSAFLGKWHVGGGDLAGHRPQDFGFEAITYQDEGWSGYFNDVRRSWHLPGPPAMAEYLTDDLTKVSIDWMRRHVAERPDTPFLLLLSHFAVHGPIEAKAEDVAYFENRATRGWNEHQHPVYAAMIRSLDDSVGALREALKELGVADNTIVIFTSDNGGIVDLKGEDLTSNQPLRGQKAQIFEGGVRVPFIIYLPAADAAGTWVDTPVALEDLAPSLLEFAGWKVSEEIQEQFTGQSLLPLLQQRPGDFPKRTLFIHEPYYRPNPLAAEENTQLPPSTSAIDGNYKLIAFHDGVMKLFNLADDIGEQVDISAAMPERVYMMQRRIMDWRINHIPARYDTRKNPDYNPRGPAAVSAPDGDLFVR